MDVLVSPGEGESIQFVDKEPACEISIRRLFPGEIRRVYCWYEWLRLYMSGPIPLSVLHRLERPSVRISASEQLEQSPAATELLNDLRFEYYGHPLIRVGDA